MGRPRKYPRDPSKAPPPDVRETFYETEAIDLDKEESILHQLAGADALPVTDSLQCILCRKIVADKLTLIAHKRSHTGVHPYKCKLCTYVATEQARIRKHLRIHHSRELNEAIEDRQAAGFKVAQSLRTLQKVTTFKCEKCEKIVASAYALKVHERTHTGEKPYKCPNCVFSATTQGHLNLHIRMDMCKKLLNETPESNLIKKTLIGFDEVDKEIRRLGADLKPTTDPFQCLLCRKTFIKQYNLHLHYALHTAIRLLKCKVCDFSSRDDDVIKDHIREAHPSYSAPVPVNSISGPLSDSTKFENVDKYIMASEVDEAAVHAKVVSLAGPAAQPVESQTQCVLCRKVLSCPGSLQLHYRSHIGLQPYKCKLCEFSTTRLQVARTHVSCWHPGGTTRKFYHKTKMRSRFEKRDVSVGSENTPENTPDLEQEEAAQTENRLKRKRKMSSKMAESLADSQQPSTSRPERVRSNRIRGQQFECYQCPFTTASRRALQTHLKAHDDLSSDENDEISSEESESDMSTEENSVEPPSNGTPSNGNLQEPAYTCVECSRTFSGMEMLENHRCVPLRRSLAAKKTEPTVVKTEAKEVEESSPVVDESVVRSYSPPQNPDEMEELPPQQILPKRPVTPATLPGRNSPVVPATLPGRNSPTPLVPVVQRVSPPVSSCQGVSAMSLMGNQLPPVSRIVLVKPPMQQKPIRVVVRKPMPPREPVRVPPSSWRGFPGCFPAEELFDTKPDVSTMQAGRVNMDNSPCSTGGNTNSILLNTFKSELDDSPQRPVVADTKPLSECRTLADLNEAFLDEYQIIDKLIKEGYLINNPLCEKCGQTMRLRGRIKDGKPFKHWRCRSTKSKDCSVTSIKKGSFFSRGSIPLKSALTLAIMWMNEEPGTRMERELNLTAKTVLEYKGIFRILCTARVASYEPNGGPGKTVQVDISSVCCKTGKDTEKEYIWVLSGVEVGTRKCFATILAEPSADAILPVLLDNIQKESEVESQLWNSHETLKQYFPNHKTVEHSMQNAVKEQNGMIVFANQLSSLWHRMRNPLKQASHNVGHFPTSFLDEFVVREREGDKFHEVMFAAIKGPIQSPPAAPLAPVKIEPAEESQEMIFVPSGGLSSAV